MVPHVVFWFLIMVILNISGLFNFHLHHREWGSPHRGGESNSREFVGWYFYDAKKVTPAFPAPISSLHNHIQPHQGDKTSVWISDFAWEIGLLMKISCLQDSERYHTRTFF
jgi:hypothetical protein